MYTLYRHISPSNKVYVGITCRKPEWRWNHGKGYCHGDQPYFANAITKYGWENIRHQILFRDLTEEKAKRFEVELIRFYKMLGISYNITDGGDGHRGTYDRSHVTVSDETRRKMSDAHKGRFCGTLNPMFGRHETAPSYGKFGRKHPASKKVYQYDKSGVLIKKWDCLSDAERELGILVTNITAVCKGKVFTAGGFRWSYTYPYMFSQEEEIRRENKRRKLSARARERYKQEKRMKQPLFDKPLGLTDGSCRQFDLELRQQDKALAQTKEIEMKKISAQAAKSKTQK